MRAFLGLGIALLWGCEDTKPPVDLGMESLDLSVATDQATPEPPDQATPDQATPDLAVNYLIVPGTCTESGWCWENPRPQGNQLHGLWSFARDDVWAVGDAGTVLHFDGTAWTGVASGTVSNLRAVWASGPRDAWAVGDDGVILRYDGQRWQAVASGTQATLWTVFGFGPGDIWIGGDDGLLLHGQGGTFAPVASGTLARVAGLWGMAANDLWALTSPGGLKPMLHWDGQRWTATFGGSTAGGALFGVSGRDAWVTGGTPVRWDGALWTDYIDPRYMPGYGLWASGPTDYWAVGGALIGRWDGKQWLPRLAPEVDVTTRESLQAVRGSGASDVWVASYRPHRWDGARWTSFGGGERPSVQRGWAVSATEAWAITETGVLRRTSQGLWLAMPPIPRGTYRLANYPQALWGTGANDLWVVGATGDQFELGFIHHWDGSQWRVFAEGKYGTLSSIHGFSASSIYAVGLDGLVIKWDGASWKKIPTGINHHLVASWAGPDGTFWAAGSDRTDATVVRIKNDIVTVEPVPQSGYIFDLTGDASGNLWAAAQDAIYARKNSIWSKSYERVGEEFYRISARGERDVVATSSLHALFRWDGVQWTQQLAPSQYTADGLFSLPGGPTWMTGYRGMVLVLP